MNGACDEAGGREGRAALRSAAGVQVARAAHACSTEPLLRYPLHNWCVTMSSAHHHHIQSPHPREKSADACGGVPKNRPTLVSVWERPRHGKRSKIKYAEGLQPEERAENPVWFWLVTQVTAPFQRISRCHMLRVDAALRS